jgi:hypothetical protein
MSSCLYFKVEMIFRQICFCLNVTACYPFFLLIGNLEVNTIHKDCNCKSI